MAFFDNMATELREGLRAIARGDKHDEEEPGDESDSRGFFGDRTSSGKKTLARREALLPPLRKDSEEREVEEPSTSEDATAAGGYGQPSR